MVDMSWKLADPDILRHRNKIRERDDARRAKLKGMPDDEYFKVIDAEIEEMQYWWDWEREHRQELALDKQRIRHEIRNLWRQDGTKELVRSAYAQWQEKQRQEKEWWHNCINTITDDVVLDVAKMFHEEQKATIDRNLKRLKRLIDFQEGRLKYEDMESLKIRALDAKIQEIYDFQVIRGPMGGRYTAICPFHDEKTPSFTIYDKHGRSNFHCFGCQVNGDVIDFWMKAHVVDFRTAVKQLAQYATT